MHVALFAGMTNEQVQDLLDDTAMLHYRIVLHRMLQDELDRSLANAVTYEDMSAALDAHEALVKRFFGGAE